MFFFFGNFCDSVLEGMPIYFQALPTYTYLPTAPIPDLYQAAVGPCKIRVITSTTRPTALIQAFYCTIRVECMAGQWLSRWPRKKWHAGGRTMSCRRKKHCHAGGRKNVKQGWRNNVTYAEEKMSCRRKKQCHASGRNNVMLAEETMSSRRKKQCHASGRNNVMHVRMKLNNRNF